YREKDTQSVGSDTFGDRLTAVTVRTNGTLSESHIKSVSLEANNTTLATASDPTPYGSWVLEPQADTAWFGPGNASTEFSLHATVTADAPGGKTVALEVPQVSDADGDGAYDPGDTGLFLEQDAPRGGLGPGATLTVEQTAEQSVQSDSPTPVALSLQAPETNISTTDDVIPVTVRGNDSERALEVALKDVDNGTVAQSRSGELDATGTAAFAFEALPGRYQIHVNAVATNDSARSESFTVEPPTSIRFLNRTAAVQRGEPALFDIILEHSDSARIRLEGPDGFVLENVSLAAGNQSPPYEIQVLTSGRDTMSSGPGYHLEPNDSPPRTNQWISAVEQDPSKGPPTDPESPQSNDSRSAQSSEPPTSTANEPDTRSSNRSVNTPTNGSTGGTANGTVPSKSASKSAEPVGGGALAAGDYTLILTGPDNQQATAVFQVTADWSASVETLVAPRDVTLAGPSAVRTHASREDEVAVGDRLVVAVNTSGLGMFTRNISVGGPPPHAKNSKAVTQTTPTVPAGENDHTKESPSAFVSIGPNPKAESGTQTPPGLKRIKTANPDQFYVVAEAGGETVRPGSALETAVVLTEETPFVPRNDGNRSAEISGQEAMNVIEARAALGGVSENGSLDLPARDTVPINGTTTVAPGTTATVHIDGANDSFTTNMDVTVDEDGTYETTADLSDYESGTEYTVSVTADGDQLSPVRSGQFLDTRSGTDAASGAGGGGGGRWQSGSSETGAESVQTETSASTPTTGPADSLPEPDPELPKKAIQRAWSAVPEPLRIGPTQLLLIALGSLALLAVGLGIRRLVRP
ncbi:BGTF surface domain-containing protein, partial [Halodesulfurarchaeum sp.]|uniref:BGTF surface domain-containing protein n=1 Tax=Halodesulfurarchaeum sp. TaxID=1980530 RepID=UPI002FC3612D